MAAILKVKQGSEWTDIPAIVGRKGDPGPKGNPGDDGYSPTVTVTDITGGHRVTITDEDGPHSFDVMDGQGAVESVNGQTGAVTLDAGDLDYDDQETYDAGTVGKELGDLKTEIGELPTDVQVAGVSVVTDGVANVPETGIGQFGVCKIHPDYGITILAHTLYINAPTESQIKPAVNNSKPITPAKQHLSTFYGLAKAAGADMASISSTTVGVYPEAQKSAIQTMLGLSAILGPVEGATASTAYSVGDAFLHGGALYKATASIAANDAIVPGTNCEQTTLIDLMKGA